MRFAGRAGLFCGAAVGVLALVAALWLGFVGASGRDADRVGARPLVSITQTAASGHTPLHINCKHHSHGAAWHKDHGRILGAKREDPDDEDLPGRPPLR